MLSIFFVVLWAVVNTSAMVGAAGLPAEVHSVADDYRPLCETNLFGMAAVTSAFMPLLVASRGRVVNTGSLSGIVAIPGNISQVATESAIVAWSEALRFETTHVISWTYIFHLLEDNFEIVVYAISSFAWRLSNRKTQLLIDTFFRCQFNDSLNAFHQ